MRILLNSFGLALLALLSTATVQQCGKPAITPKTVLGSDGRVIGGQEAVPGSWPWLVHLQMDRDGEKRFDCGASIISGKWIISAAHCFVREDNCMGELCHKRLDTDASHYKARVGQHRNSDGAGLDATARDYPIRRIIIHELYNMAKSDSPADIALLEVDGLISFTSVVSPVCLPTARSDPPAGQSCVVAGWGETIPQLAKLKSVPLSGHSKASSTVVMQVGVDIVNRRTCNSTQYYNGVISDDMICAGTAGKDACQGDSGGPLVCKDAAGAYTLEGVVSWGEGCGAYQKPGVFARVGHFIPWIEAKSDINSGSPAVSATVQLCLTVLLILSALTF
ncbi:putative Acrosin [Hypsibius exemplaris]|uniref:Acrosin n=1 Tax=Hypsibius exemplaris TaxID=2072580 RepID=A0A1W0XDW7_HYPEX|nr:putative Acrosin [Hypsibius exemplaris]